MRELYNVVAVVLHYNANDNLKQVIKGVTEQSFPVQQIIVIDNGSNSFDPLPEKSTVELVKLGSNLGVGKGHNIGWRLAIEKYDADLIWSIEHDCVPESNCLEKLIEQYNPNHLACYCAIEKNDLDYERYRYYMFDSRGFSRILDKTKLKNYKGGLSFNGLLIPIRVLNKVGFLNEDYFVGGEDIDFYKRIYRHGGYSLRVTNANTIHNMHKQKKGFKVFNCIFFLTQQGLFRDYYSTRNSIYNARKSGYSSFRILISWLRGLLITLLFRNKKIKRLKIRYFALKDGWKGRMGFKQIEL